MKMKKKKNRKKKKKKYRRVRDELTLRITQNHKLYLTCENRQKFFEQWANTF